MRRSLLALPLMCPAVAAAAPAEFILDTPNSFLTIGGNVAGAPITQQGAGSLRTTYVGNILANLSPGTIEFVGGSGDANVTGSWQPLPDGSLGSAPADYGGKFKVLIFFDAFFAIRDLVIAGTSGPLALSGAGTFDSTGVTFTALRGDLAFNAAALSQMGASTLDGSAGQNQATSPGSITISPITNGATATLFVPALGAFVVNSATLGTATLTFTGQTQAHVSSIFGDASFDRTVDIGDFAILGSNFNLPGDWLAGDFDFTGTVGIADFAQLAANFNQSAPALPRGGAVPEPAAGLPLVTLLLRRRRR